MEFGRSTVVKAHGRRGTKGLDLRERRSRAQYVFFFLWVAPCHASRIKRTNCGFPLGDRSAFVAIERR